MNWTELFNEAFGVDPLLLPPSNEYIADSLASMRRRYGHYLPQYHGAAAAHGPVRKIAFHFLNDWSLNAGAATVGDADLVCINAGSVAILGNVFNSVMTSPRVMRRVKGPLRPRGRAAPILARRWAPPLAIRLKGNGPLTREEWPYGKDPRRRIFANFCATFATDFLFLHELAHVGLGHTKFVADESGGATMVEIEQIGGGARLTPEQCAQRRVFEFQADSFAALETGGNWHLTGFENLAFRSSDEAFRAWCFALLTLFALFDRGSGKVAPAKSDTHPHPLVRLLTVLFSADDVALEFKSKSRSSLWRQFSEALEGVREVAGFLGKGATLLGGTEDLEQAHHEYMQLLQATNELEPRLAGLGWM